MRTTISILMVLVACYLNAQDNFRINKYCDNNSVPFDYVMVGSKKVRFQIVDFSSLKILKRKDEYSVDCILPDFSSKSDKYEIKQIAIQLRKLNPKFTEFTFFNSCEVYTIYLSSTYPTGERDKKLKHGYIGNFKI